MYIETSLRTQNDTANLESPLINFATNGNAQGTVCVRFWYHMYGAHVDALNVFIKTGSTLPSKPVWMKKGTQGDKWRLAQIVVNRTPAFKVSNDQVINKFFLYRVLLKCLRHFYAAFTVMSCVVAKPRFERYVTSWLLHFFEGFAFVVNG